MHRYDISIGYMLYMYVDTFILKIIELDTWYDIWIL